MIYEKIKELTKVHVPNDIHFHYGTAGFRSPAKILDTVVFRMGILTALKSLCSTGRQTGFMITASHNPADDNGVKIFDCNGDLLDSQWELLATELANKSNEELLPFLKQMMEKYQLSIFNKPTVWIGFDTRKSCPRLLQCAKDGIAAVNGHANVIGMVTTPMLQYLIAHACSIENYYENFTSAFLNFVELLDNDKLKNYVPHVMVDCANGVGSIHVKAMAERLGSFLKIALCNTSTVEGLNENCGADYIYMKQAFPTGLDVGSYGYNKFASFDGDADRIMYFYTNENGKFELLDGDKIATLIGGYIQKLIQASGVKLKLGIVQTAYANGASTRYIEREMLVEVKCVQTGVKNLHAAAHDFDIGVYAEANGHATFLFSSKSKDLLFNFLSQPNLSNDAVLAIKKLLALSEIPNSKTGDAICDLFLIEAILRANDWTLADWQATYTPLSYRQKKLTIPDRYAVVTTDADRRVVAPSGLQAKIDECLVNFKLARSFVRPSGTEDIVRIYSEADTDEAAEQLGLQVVDIVKKFF